MPPRILVLGEGQDEEGVDYYVVPDPGQPIDEDRLGSAHILVRRVFHELFLVTAAEIIAPPRLRSRRRPGNQGLIADLRGDSRSSYDQPRKDGKPRGWLEFCLGATEVDIAVILKDAPGGREEDIRREILHAVAGRRRPEELMVVAAAATPSIEGWLLELDENDKISEKRAKEIWIERRGPRESAAKAGIARSVDLAGLVARNPNGFGRLVQDIGEVVQRFGAPKSMTVLE